MKYLARLFIEFLLMVVAYMVIILFVPVGFFRKLAYGAMLVGDDCFDNLIDWLELEEEDSK